MTVFIIRRLLQASIVILSMSLIVFVAINLVGDPLAVLFGIPLGVYAGLHPDSPVSKTIMAGSILGFSLPTFWVGIMMILLFAVMLGWLPSTGRGDTVTILGLRVSFLTWNGLQRLLLPA